VSVARRAFLAQLLLPGAALLLPRTGWAAGVSSGAQDLDVVVLGDSMIEGAFGRALRDRLRARGQQAERFGKRSTGLARPDFFDWIGHAASLVEAHRPERAVVMLGGNDAQGLYIGRARYRRSAQAQARIAPSKELSKAERRRARWIRWGESEWEPEYRARVRALAAVLPERQFWVGMPVMGRPRLHERMAKINEMLSAELGAAFVDIWTVLADEDGHYTDTRIIDGTRTRIRAHDGVHINGAGAQLLAEHVLPKIV
jgi:hypothetical protein